MTAVFLRKQLEQRTPNEVINSKWGPFGWLGLHFASFGFPRNLRIIWVPMTIWTAIINLIALPIQSVSRGKTKKILNPYTMKN